MCSIISNLLCIKDCFSSKVCLLLLDIFFILLLVCLTWLNLFLVLTDFPLWFRNVWKCSGFGLQLLRSRLQHWLSRYATFIALLFTERSLLTCDITSFAFSPTVKMVPSKCGLRFSLCNFAIQMFWAIVGMMIFYKKKTLIIAGFSFHTHICQRCWKPPFYGKQYRFFLCPAARGIFLFTPLLVLTLF